MEFQNKTVIISGGASGLGFLSGLCFAKEGANVVLTDVNPKALEEKVEEIREKGGKCIGVVTDVRDYAQVTEACRQAVETFSTIDILINCAGGAETRMCGVGGEFHQVPIEVYDWGVDVNLKGQLYFDHAVMQYMTRQNSGVIIHLGSITGQEGCMSNVAYSASKSAAMNGLTKSIALAGAPYNVRSVCVAPGPVLTRPGMASMKTLIGRAAQPQEIVDLFLYLASEKGAFINGVTILADGGRNVMRNKG